MSWRKQLIEELDLVRECERAGEELKASFDQLHRGKYTVRAKQREKFESLLEPLNKLVASQTRSPQSRYKAEPLASSTPFQPKNIPDLDTPRSLYPDEESSIMETAKTASNTKDTTTDANDTENQEEQLLRSTLGPGAMKYLNDLAERVDYNPKFDTTFGIRYEENTPYVGNSPIVVKDDRITLPDGSTYAATPGLWELLVLNEPMAYTPQDVEAYGDILQKTYAYKQHNDPGNPYIKSNAGYKYVRVIREILNSRGLIRPRKDLVAPSFVTRSQAKSVKGSGLSKIYTGAPVEYVYWDSIDELLERLYILYGELKAGNTNPSIINEIVNIIQEFKELK